MLINILKKHLKMNEKIQEKMSSVLSLKTKFAITKLI